MEHESSSNPFTSFPFCTVINDVEKVLPTSVTDWGDNAQLLKS